jgi:site-specific recombinase XerC
VEGFMGHLLQTRSAVTASVRFRALQQYFRWLVDDEVIPLDPMAKMKVPSVPEQPVPVLSEDNLRALLATCRPKSFEDRRDEAIIRIMPDTGVRRGELLGMTCDAVDLDVGVVNVLGKGGRWRQVPVGTKTARALDRYSNLRSRQASEGSTPFWLTLRGTRLQESGLATMLSRRGTRAGLGRSTPTNSDTRSLMRGCPKAGMRATSCAWRDGGRGICSRATAHRRLMSALGRPTGA